MKLRNKKGFTLIELMIVIVILGILMASVLPRLTGAQARGRDTARVADLNNIASALQVYYDDYGEFPGDKPAAGPDAGDGYCLNNDPSETISSAIKGYLKGEEVPVDPSKGANGTLCNATGTGFYWYKPLVRNGVDNNGYVLCSDAETFQKANTILDDNGGSGTELDETATDYANMKDAIDWATGDNMLAADTADATNSLFCIMN